MDEFGTEKNAIAQCKALNINYEQKRPKLSERANLLFYAFSVLNRRRIDTQPLQKADIIDEIKELSYPDKSLEVIESLDSYWLAGQAKKLKRKMGG
jgi:hypothetical protein